MRNHLLIRKESMMQSIAVRKVHKPKPIPLILTTAASQLLMISCSGQQSDSWKCKAILSRVTNSVGNGNKWVILKEID